MSTRTPIPNADARAYFLASLEYGVNPLTGGTRPTVDSVPGITRDTDHRAVSHASSSQAGLDAIRNHTVKEG